MRQQSNQAITLILEYIGSTNDNKIISIVGKSLYEADIIQSSVHLGGGETKEILKKDIENSAEDFNIDPIIKGTKSASGVIYEEIEKYRKIKILYSGIIIILLGFYFLKSQFYSVEVSDSWIILASIILAVFYFSADKHVTNYETEYRRLLFLAEKIRISKLVSVSFNEKIMLFDNISIEQAIVNTKPIKNQINIGEQKGNINIDTNTHKQSQIN